MFIFPNLTHPSEICSSPILFMESFDNSHLYWSLFPWNLKIEQLVTVWCFNLQCIVLLVTVSHTTQKKSECYRTEYLCSPSSFSCWNLIPQCDGLWQWGLWEWLGHDSGALMNGISALIKEALESSRASSHHVRSAKRPGSSSHQTLHLGTLILLFVSHPVYGLLW